MADSISEHSTHISRLHHHRNRVQAARAALDEAISERVASHYAEREAAVKGSVPETPVEEAGDQKPPTSQPTIIGPDGAGNGAGNE
jgi:hypothetical protein